MSYSVSHMKAIKRQRARGMEWTPGEYDPDDDEYERWGFRQLATLPSSGPHAPNKKESKLLRSICSRTGLTEQQVREHRTYRQQLARAATPPPSSRHPGFRLALQVRREVTARTGMHPYHPSFAEEFAKAWEWHLRWRGRAVAEQLLSANEALSVSLQKHKAPAQAER